MSDIEKGEIVVSIVRGDKWRVRGWSQEWVDKGDELRVTSVRGDDLNVQQIIGGNVFRMSRSEVRRVRPVGVMPPDAIPLDHPGLAWLWEDASRLADRFGFCKEFDRLADALGAPGRERQFRIPMVSEDEIRVTATVTARSRRLAEQRIRDRIASSAPLELTGGAA